MRLGRKKAIRLKCLDCMCGSAFEVRCCTTKSCPLWCYRMGYEVDYKTGKRLKARKEKSNEFNEND